MCTFSDACTNSQLGEWTTSILLDLNPWPSSWEANVLATTPPSQQCAAKTLQASVVDQDSVGGSSSIERKIFLNLEIKIMSILSSLWDQKTEFNITGYWFFYQCVVIRYLDMWPIYYVPVTCRFKCVLKFTKLKGVKSGFDSPRINRDHVYLLDIPTGFQTSKFFLYFRD